MRLIFSISAMLLCMQLHAGPNGNGTAAGQTPGQTPGETTVSSDNPTLGAIASESHGEDVRAVAGAPGVLQSASYEGGDYVLQIPTSLERMALGPPLITDPRGNGEDRDEDENEYWRGAAEWTQLAMQIEEAHAMGIETISVDAWWGLCMRSDGSYNFDFMDKVFEIIRKPHPRTGKKLKIAPILSAHRYGRNVNDHGATITLPKPILQKMKARGWGYKSELGNENLEAISPWGVKEALSDFQGFWRAFRDHYKSWADDFSKIVIGMGPAGELVLPAYHSHDRAKPRPNHHTSEAEFPGRGVLQHRSDLAIASLQKWLRNKYKTIEALKAKWKTDYPLKTTTSWADFEKVEDFEQLDILATPEQVDEFFAGYGQYSEMGQDFFDWLHESLILDQGLALGMAATDVFSEKGTGLEKVRLAMKVGGVHWQFHDRIPLLTAGLATTRGAKRVDGTPPKSWQPADWTLERGAGMRRIFTDVLVPLRRYAALKGSGDWVGIFTCAEMESCKIECLDTDSTCFGRCQDCPHARHIAGQARSGAAWLTEAILYQAGEHQIPTYIENALEGNLNSEEAMRRIDALLDAHPHIFGVSLLRLGTAIQSEPARQFYARQHARRDRRLPARPVELARPRGGLSLELPIISQQVTDSGSGQLPCSTRLLLVDIDDER